MDFCNSFLFFKVCLSRFLKFVFFNKFVYLLKCLSLKLSFVIYIFIFERSSKYVNLSLRAHLKLYMKYGTWREHGRMAYNITNLKKKLSF